MLHTLDTGDAEMKKGNGKTYLFWIGLSEAVGALSGLLSRSGIQAYTAQAVQPRFSPPPVVFPIVWGILYALMGFGMARIRLGGGGKQAQNLFVAQLVATSVVGAGGIQGAGILPAGQSRRACPDSLSAVAHLRRGTKFLRLAVERIALHLPKKRPSHVSGQALFSYSTVSFTSSPST